MCVVRETTVVTSSFDRLPSLTGLRFIAAFVVFAFHARSGVLLAAPGADPTSGVMGFLFTQGATGVSFFFVLSGFVLTWSAREGDTAVRFWRRRAAKIYPNHLVTALAALAIAVALATTPSVFAIVTNLLLLQAWVPQESVYFSLNVPSWSLACEAFFYLCFPLLLAGIRRLRDSWLWPAVLAGFAAVAAVPLVSLVASESLTYWVVYLLPPVRMIEFVIGILLAQIVRKGRWIPFGVLPAVALAVAGYLASGYLPGPFSWVAGTVVPFALLIPAVATADLRGGRSVLRAPAMVWLGEVSFAFYLVHLFTIRITGEILPQRSWSLGVQVLLLVAMGAVTLLASWALWRVVEQPMMRVLAGRRTPPARTPDARPPAPRTVEPRTVGPRKVESRTVESRKSTPRTAGSGTSVPRPRVPAQPGAASPGTQSEANRPQ